MKTILYINNRYYTRLDEFVNSIKEAFINNDTSFLHQIHVLCKDDIIAKWLKDMKRIDARAEMFYDKIVAIGKDKSSEETLKVIYNIFVSDEIRRIDIGYKINDYIGLKTVSYWTDYDQNKVVCKNESTIEVDSCKLYFELTFTVIKCMNDKITVYINELPININLLKKGEQTVQTQRHVEIKSPIIHNNSGVYIKYNNQVLFRCSCELNSKLYRIWGLCRIIHGCNEVKSFAMSPYPVTQEQWEYIMGNNPVDPESKLRGNNKPVVSFKYDDCVKFLKTLNDRTGGVFRLPTVKEWEYAAMGGESHKRFAGSNNIDDVAWYRNNSHGQLQDVDTKIPNQFKLYNMSGNVWEICSDIDKNGFQIAKGGSFQHSAIYCEIKKDWRFAKHCTEEMDCIGIRLAMDYDEA